MTPTPAPASPTFQFVARGLVALHALIAEGRDDSPEAEAIRDSLDGPIAALAPAEKERARWLSEDLYSADESSVGGGAGSAGGAALGEADKARRRGDWDGALAVLRGFDGVLPAGILNQRRGEVWAEAGFPEVAAAFARRPVATSAGG